MSYTIFTKGGSTYISSKEDKTYNITIKNVRGEGYYAISLAGAMKNLVLFGIEAANGAKMIKDERSNLL